MILPEPYKVLVLRDPNPGDPIGYPVQDKNKSFKDLDMAETFFTVEVERAEQAPNIVSVWFTVWHPQHQCLMLIRDWGRDDS